MSVPDRDSPASPARGEQSSGAGAQPRGGAASSSSSSAAAVASAKEAKNEAKSVPEEYFSSDDSGGSDAESQKQRGNFFYKKKRYAKAVGYFTTAIRMAPDTSVLYSNRAMCFNAKEEFQKAVLDAEAAVQRDEWNQKAYFQGCKALFALRQFDKCAAFSLQGQAAFRKKDGADRGEAAVKTLKEWSVKAEAQLKKQLAETAEMQEDIDAARSSVKAKALEVGKAKYAKGDVVGAVQEFEKVLLETMKFNKQANESSSSGTTPSTPSVASLSGAESHGEVIDMKPDLEAYKWLGKCFMRVQKPKEALDTFKAQLNLQLKLEEPNEKCRNEIAMT